MLLQYNASTVPGEAGQWEARPISDVLNDFSGGSGLSVVESLDSIENPRENDIVVSGQELFIYDGTEWQPLTNSALENRVSALETKVGLEADADSGQVATGLYKKLDDLRTDLESEISNAVAGASHLRYQVVSSLDDIDVSDADSVSNIVFLVPKSSEDARVDDGYDEYLVNNGALEKIGSWDADLAGYVQDDDNRLLTMAQKQKLDSIGLNEDNQATISASQVGNLADFISNNQLIKSVEAGTFNVTDAGELQLVSVPADALTNYVSTTVFSSTVGNLNDILGRAEDANTTLVDEINSIKASILWQELSAR